MRTNKFILILVLCTTVFVYTNSCKSHEILPGTISGYVTDAETSQPIQAAKVILNPQNDTVSTGSDGKYLFENLEAGNYEVQASKFAYEKKSNSVIVTAAKTTEVNFSLKGVPVAKMSDEYLDFGFELTSKKITISNAGKGSLIYSITSDQPWISIEPSSGEATTQTDTLTVTIDNTGFYSNTQTGNIYIISTVGQETLQDTVNIYANGLMDREMNYYAVVKIGTQTWMAENLNVGTLVGGGSEQNDFQINKKYCYNNSDANCELYGALYKWSQMMMGTQQDSGAIGTTKGVCPVGWHVPTAHEWTTLMEYLSEPVAGEKIKEAGTEHWKSPNIATNETGFTALPGGFWDGFRFDLMTTHEYFWTATTDPATGYRYGIQLEYNSGKAFFKQFQNEALAVRCVKNP